jgi:ATP-dependent exoDNAse (exonuclease V) beta subunit
MKSGAQHASQKEASSLSSRCAGCTTLCVEAAAGTGKTTVLIGRIVSLIRDGVSTLDRVVAVTFTEKAAGEMKLRLRTEIERARQDANAEEQRRLERALSELELARIGTIHAFCGDLLRERPVEAGIDPLFDVAAEDEAQELADEAFQTWFQAALADPPEAVRRVLRRRSKLQSPRDALRNALGSLIEHRDFPAPWRRDPFDRTGAIDTIMKQLTSVGALAAESSWPDDYLARNLAEIARFAAENARAEGVRGRDYDGLEASLRDLARARSWGWQGARRTRFGALQRDEVLLRRDALKRDLDAFVAASDADLAPLLHEALQSAVGAYELLKSRAGRLDFLDLLIKTRNLVRDDVGVRTELQRRFTHFFVDEFQDTDPLQAEILQLLSAQESSELDARKIHPVPGKLFLVGDPKQSIYRFRRADVAVYEEVKKKLLENGAELLHLTTSFRSPPSLQSFVNVAFAPVMGVSADESQAAYVPLDKSRPEIAGRLTIVALPVPRPYGNYGKIVNWRIEESLPDAAGAFIDWLTNESGWTVEEDGKQVAVRPRHICILFRRFRNFSSDMTRPYVRALERRRVPHVLMGGRSFHDREEVIALRNALVAIEWPDDELRVFATLRGPLFALGDEALLAFRQYLESEDELRIRRLHPMHAVDRGQLHPIVHEVADALALLARLHAGRNHRPIAQTISMLLEAVRAHAGIALWPTGEQALANSLRLVDKARHFERGASSFRAFVEQMEADAERGEADEAPIVEEGTEGVRVMTVHKAKGLEFPVVILADPTCPATRDVPSRHVDPIGRRWLEPLCGCSPVELLEASEEELRRDRAEAVRVAYVAATRARDLLVAPVCGDALIAGWLGVLQPVLHPSDDARRTSRPVPGCPNFGDKSVLDRGSDGVPPPGGAVRPGLHESRAGGPPVVWWDPAVLRLDVEEQAPIRQQHILEADPDGSAAAAGEQMYAQWKSVREETLGRASQPSISVQTVTSVARSQTGDDRIQIERVAGIEADRPSGRRFGVLVHSLLAAIDFNAEPAAIQAAAAVHGRLVDATTEEIDAAANAILAALAHPIMRAAAGAGSGGLRRETPILLHRAAGALIEGVVDLAIREETPDFNGWTVVDFKTSHEFEGSRAEYSAQVGLYVEAIQKATHLPARGFLLVV